MQLDLGPVSATIIGLLILFLGGSVWVGISLFLVGLGILFFQRRFFGSILSNIAWNNTSGSAMMALPFFIWMGEILFRSRISSDLFKGSPPGWTLSPGGSSRERPGMHLLCRRERLLGSHDGHRRKDHRPRARKAGYDHDLPSGRWPARAPWVS